MSDSVIDIFEYEKVDMQALPLLNDQHLKELDLTVVSRNRVHEAISMLSK